ncbi:m7GpppN-mRNA hydrolase [Aplysia californica]|uniref:M7GpppN-mRNA hydrolase n=1 Tax=Aplysia californica TaxID=6500 RepID=A0ABM0K449_APLCA|nr:m7GpppN-mRNA hydrolase [Aplysia californica]
MDNSSGHKFARAISRRKCIPAYVLNDLSSRFIINTRPEEVKSIIRIFFHIETAYWFYLDFHCVENAQLKECTMREFSYDLINHVPQLKQYLAEFDKHFDAWKQYKRTIGTYGAIIIDQTMKHVLLVQSFSGRNSWGFPKGKINQNETPVDCAAREVLEETGFDIRPHVDPYEYLEKNFNEQLNRLYLIDGIPWDTAFQPKTRREIRDIQWFPLEMLLTAKTESLLKETVGQNVNLYTVVPYLRAIKKWIHDKQSGDGGAKQRNRQRQQKQFSQQNQSQYQEYMQLKKGKITPKNFVNQRKTSVRYSRDILEFQENQVKQGRRGMTVVQSLFGHREQRPAEVYKPPEVDTNSFYSQAWFNFSLDTDGILELLPHEGTYYFPTRKV